MYNFFIENFTKTEIITKDNEYVNFDKFREAYVTYKMNIYDILDLMTGNYWIVFTIILYNIKILILNYNTLIF